MKCFCRTLLTIVLFVAAVLVGLRVYTYRNTSECAAMIDRLNPLVKTKILYVKTSGKYEYCYPDAVSKVDNYLYIQTCYTGEGEPRKMKFVSFSKKLHVDRYLKLTVKGQYVLFWEEINQEELPEKAATKLC
ncbi:YxeA family protein [Erwinia sp. CPCC 100877]|nr:YxeA family protein [Erwinia sp. CPCC 100877]